jgi:formate/nitrite transporter FocA (FNT family)
LLQLCFGAMLVQIVTAGSGTLRTDYPSLITLIAAFFFPVGLVRRLSLLDREFRLRVCQIMLVLTGQELCTANFSEHPSCWSAKSQYTDQREWVLTSTTVIMPMSTLKGRTKLWELPVNWIIVFFGNLAGALCFVAFMGKLPSPTVNRFPLE